MERLGVDLDFLFIYMDDILVASRDEATQMAHLRLHMERMREFRLVSCEERPGWITAGMTP
jgi:hypothetical protein